MIGRFVISRAGHDKDQVYVVTAAGADCLYLADGRFKTVAAPKKKNRKHVQLTRDSVEPQLLAAITGKAPDVDVKIKYAIKQYLARSQRTKRAAEMDERDLRAQSASGGNICQKVM